MRHLTPHTWYVTHDPWRKEKSSSFSLFSYRCYSLHMSRDLVSPVCGIIWSFFTYQSKVIHKWSDWKIKFYLLCRLTIHRINPPPLKKFKNFLLWYFITTEDWLNMDQLQCQGPYNVLLHTGDVCWYALQYASLHCTILRCTTWN